MPALTCEFAPGVRATQMGDRFAPYGGFIPINGPSSTSLFR